MLPLPVAKIKIVIICTYTVNNCRNQDSQDERIYRIIVELKALINLEDVHLAQAKNYVVAYNFPIGLLINFGAKSLQFKKIFNAKYNPKILES